MSTRTVMEIVTGIIAVGIVAAFGINGSMQSNQISQLQQTVQQLEQQADQAPSPVQVPPAAATQPEPAKPSPPKPDRQPATNPGEANPVNFYNFEMRSPKLYDDPDLNRIVIGPWRINYMATICYTENDSIDDLILKEFAKGLEHAELSVRGGDEPSITLLVQGDDKFESALDWENRDRYVRLIDDDHLAIRIFKNGIWLVAQRDDWRFYNHAWPHRSRGRGWVSWPAE